MKVYNSILAHPGWETRIKPLLRVEYYGREGRPRIETISGLTLKQWTYLMGLRVKCSRHDVCGNSISPFRPRKKGGRVGHDSHLFFAASCTLEESVGCSRSHAASEEYGKVVAAIEE